MLFYDNQGNMNYTNHLDLPMSDMTWDSHSESHDQSGMLDDMDTDYPELRVTSLNQEIVLLRFDWIITVTIIVAMVMTLMGNLLVIYFICSEKKSRTAQNISIVSLCVASILQASFVIPTYLVITTHAVSPRDQMAMFLCKLHVYVWYWCKTVTIYSICALICDRYSHDTQPNKNHMLSGRYMFFLSFVWFFGAAYNIWDIIIKLADYVTVTGPDGHNATVRRCVSSAQFSYIQNGLVYADILVIYVLPFCIACYMYGAIIHHRFCKQTDCIRQSRHNKKNAFTIALLLAFYICQLPHEVMEAWGFFLGTETYKLVLVKKIVEVVSLSHGVINVLVYVVFSSELHDVITRKLHARATYARVSRSSRIPQIHVNGDDVTRDHGNGIEMSVVVTEGQV